MNGRWSVVYICNQNMCRVFQCAPAIYNIRQHDFELLTEGPLRAQ